MSPRHDGSRPSGSSEEFTRSADPASAPYWTAADSGDGSDGYGSDGDGYGDGADDRYDDGYDDPQAASSASRSKRSRWRRALIIVLVSGLVLGGCAVGAFFYFSDRYLGNIDRIANPFAGIDDSQRPAPATPAQDGAQAPLTFLLIGSDSRDPSGEGPPSARSDVIMLMRVTADRQQVQFISIPRDSWVAVPGYGLNKINAAYAFGGPTLLIRTVESVTATRIDHFAAVDFAGFKEITDALGGVDVRVARTTTSRGVTFTAGINHLNGDEALVYVRQRYDLPGGDLDRVQRQQNYMRAMMAEVFRQNMLGDLGQTDDLLLALTSAISVDETLSNTDLVGLAYSLRGLNANSLSFLTVPVAGLGTEGAQSVVYLDTARAAAMWAYLQSDTLIEHLGEFTRDQLPETPD